MTATLERCNWHTYVCQPAYDWRLTVAVCITVACLCLLAGFWIDAKLRRPDRPAE